MEPLPDGKSSVKKCAHVEFGSPNDNIDFPPAKRVTGFASAKVGRMAAFTIGGAIILLEIANEQGIIKIDWNRLTRKADQVGDKVQKAVTGEGPKWMEKVIFDNFSRFFACLRIPICARAMIK